MTFRLYDDQLAKLDAATRESCLACGTRGDGWLDVPAGCFNDPGRPTLGAAPPAPTKSRGLGDTIAKLTSAVGIKPCSRCKERQKLLNELVPYRSA